MTSDDHADAFKYWSSHCDTINYQTINGSAINHDSIRYNLTMCIGKAFDQSVAYYDNWMKSAIAGYDTIFKTAVELVPFDAQKMIRVLDLGAGTGLFSQFIFEKYHQARFVLCDLAPRMLDIAKERFKGHLDQFEIVEMDYRNLQSTGDYDLVISSLSIHHLPGEEKKTLFKNVHLSLKKGGVFINVDQIKGPTPALEQLY